MIRVYSCLPVTNSVDRIRTLVGRNFDKDGNRDYFNEVWQDETHHYHEESHVHGVYIKELSCFSSIYSSFSICDLDTCGWKLLPRIDW